MKNKNAKFIKRGKKASFEGDVKCNKVTPKFKGKNYNDFSWYDKNHQLVIDTANLPFNTQMTAPVDLMGDGYGKGLPMAMTLGHDWLIGNGSAVATAGRMLWADIRKHNSGATNYGSSDPIMIITAAADIFINIKWMSSFFGIYKYFNARNKLMPRVLFQSAAIDYQDFVTNLADYRARFNKLLLQARVITIPKKYPWIDAAMALYGNIFKDEDTDTGREQLYLVNKAAFYTMYHGDSGYEIAPVKIGDIYEDVTNFGYVDSGDPDLWLVSGDGNITGSARSQTSETVKFDLYLKILELQIRNIISDEDANIIQGDMLKAFGEGSAYTTGQIDESFEIKPIYSEEFGWYLHNATIYSSPVNVQGEMYTPQSGKVLAHTCGMITGGYPDTTFVGYGKTIRSNPITNEITVDVQYTNMKSTLENEKTRGIHFAIDTNKYSPEPSDVIWNSRAINKWYGTTHPIFSNGILINAIVWRKSIIQGQSVVGIPELETLNIQTVGTTSNPTSMRNAATVCAAFKWAPLFYIVIPMGSVSYAELVGDLNNIHICSDKELEDINDIVMYSLFDIPQR